MEYGLRELEGYVGRYEVCHILVALERGIRYEREQRITGKQLRYMMYGEFYNLLDKDKSCYTGDVEYAECEKRLQEITLSYDSFIEILCMTLNILARTSKDFQAKLRVAGVEVVNYLEIRQVYKFFEDLYTRYEK